MIEMLRRINNDLSQEAKDAGCFFVCRSVCSDKPDAPEYEFVLMRLDKSVHSETNEKIQLLKNAGFDFDASSMSLRRGDIVLTVEIVAQISSIEKLLEWLDKLADQRGKV
jgi:hypothetical protein